MNEIVEAHVIFRGNVQGVGFRATVRHLALQIGVKGTVRNQADGTVEMIAQADQATLKKLIQQIKEEFSLHIHHADINYSANKHPLEGFQIIR